MQIQRFVLFAVLGLVQMAPAFASDAARDLLAARLSVEPDQLRVEHRVVLDLPDGPLHRAKVRDLASGRLHYVDYSLGGEVADADQRARARLRARLGIEGRLSREVAEKLRSADGAERIDLAIWIQGEPGRHSFASTIADDATPAEIRRARESLLAHLRDFAERSQARILPRIAELGGKVRYASPIAPLVHIEIPARAVAGLAEHPAVDHIYSAWEQNQDLLNIQGCTVGVDPHVWDAGFTGAGIVVAHCEDSRADRDNTCLGCDAGANKPTHSNVDQHSTACTGMMVSNDPTFRGMAYEACYYSANGGSYSDSDMSSAIDSGAENSDVTSGSWGGNYSGYLNIHDRHTDYVVRNSRHFVDDAAGNGGNSGYVSSPGKAYNSLSAACGDDRDTCDPGDDIVASLSSGRDPITTHNDRELPELTAPGTDIHSLTTTSSPYCATTSVGSGTSYAAPIIGGIAALAMQAEPALIAWPEATKALLLASGLNNLEGDPRLSDLDGTGQVDASAALTSAVARRWARGVLTANHFTDGEFEVSIGSVTAGQRLKGVVCWDSNPNGSYSTDPVEADLDLAIVDPSGTVVASSNSYDNTYEVVDFVAGTSGIYRARLSYRTWDGASEYVGGAWTLSSP